MSTNSTSADHSASGSAGAPKDPREVLLQMAESISTLKKGLTTETAARRELAGTVSETLEDYASAINTIQTVLFSMLTLELDRSAPMREHSDPEVVEVATRRTELALECQAKVAPEMFERIYGYDPDTGEPVPGGVAEPE